MKNLVIRRNGINFYMKDYLSHIPPYGTTITRPMTRGERRHVGRVAYAQYAERELYLILTVLGGTTKTVTAGSYGYKVTLHFNKADALVEFRSRNGMFAPSPMRFQYSTDCNGRQTLHSWLASQDPTFIARLLKNARKQLFDYKSYEGTKRALRENGQNPSSTRNIEPFSPL